MRLTSLVRSLLFTFSFFLFPVSLSAADWLYWRGPEQNGVSREKDLPDRWSPNGGADSNLIWKAPFGCRSTPIIHGKHVYLINAVGEGKTAGERVMCLDADTGKVLWAHRFNVFFADIDISRVGWTNIVGDPQTGNIYAHGTQGFLTAFSSDGKILWQHSLIEEFGRGGGYGGRFPSPIVDGDLVILGMINGSWGDQARGANRFAAFNKKDGSLVWWADPCGPPKGTVTNYSTPIVVNINGVRQLITGTSDGSVLALKVRTGETLWKYEFADNVVHSSPVVQGTKVYICHGEENIGISAQGRVLCLDAGQIANGKPTVVWDKTGIKAGYTTPVLHDKFLYVCTDGARLVCFEADTGKQLWTHPYGRLGRGSALWADDKIYVANVNAEFYILQPGPNGCKELHKQFFPGVGETNGTPAAANGKIYFGTLKEFYCIGKKDHQAKADPIPAPAPEAPADPKAPATHLQIIPADVVVHPGQSVTFKARTFDAAGHLQKEVPVTWSLPVPPPPPNSKANPPALKGEIDKEGKLTVDKVPPGQAAYVMATLDKLTARARVRVVPPLATSYDFARMPLGATPGGWVNVQGKFVITKAPDGSIALKKLGNNPRPPLARANAYINLPDSSDYTIQADLMGDEVGQTLPDMGLVNCRYSLVLDGKIDPGDNKHHLRLISWESTPKPRVDQNVVFDWKPKVWYRVKLSVEPQKDTSLVRAKVWPRDQAEPKDWTLSFEDISPNRNGAPAVYGYVPNANTDAPGSEIYYQNLTISNNHK